MKYKIETATFLAYSLLNKNIVTIGQLKKYKETLKAKLSPLELDITEDALCLVIIKNPEYFKWGEQDNIIKRADNSDISYNPRNLEYIAEHNFNNSLSEEVIKSLINLGNKK